VTPDFEIIILGSSLGKVCQDLSNNALFTNVFKITRPQLDLIFSGNCCTLHKHIVIQHNISGITLRGQFE
jgi:hypothetical protein